MATLRRNAYTHCFFVPGGNSMHLLDAARKTMKCIPFVHEMSATIAAEYFNEINDDVKAFALLTAGPGLTHAVSGIAGAYLEGRELLVVGGQVKTSDLSRMTVRQRGIQEIDGVSLVSSITKTALRVERPLSATEINTFLQQQYSPKPGPVFLEICLDVQATDVIEDLAEDFEHIGSMLSDLAIKSLSYEDRHFVEVVARELAESERPVLLIGGGVRRNFDLIEDIVNRLSIPTMTTYNGADRLSSNHSLYFGRPNTWGMRYSNILMAQSDLVIAVGTRLGLQQTGFNWEGFAPKSKIIQIDTDPAETQKGHPVVFAHRETDGLMFLKELASSATAVKSTDWITYCSTVKEKLPLSESSNSNFEGYWNPYNFFLQLSEVLSEDDVVIPCSSGGSFTAFYQSFLNKRNQRIVSDKSLASMGYGLAGAIGAALSVPNKRVIHIEGDGGFAQNLQELATVAVQKLNLKTFLMCNNGYASIRMTQRNYFGGEYLGCDTESGLGFPDWKILCDAYGLESEWLTPTECEPGNLFKKLEGTGPKIFLVPLHPEQTFYPKINSRISANGGMESEPLWSISPHLDAQVLRTVTRYL